jgi:hypothetical protein
MQTIKIDNFTLTCKPEHTGDYLELIRKASKTRKPTVRGGAPRRYPAPSAHWSTKTYVEAYQSINGRLSIGNAYDLAALSAHVSMAQGVDSAEVEL